MIASTRQVQLAHNLSLHHIKKPLATARLTPPNIGKMETAKAVAMEILNAIASPPPGSCRRICNQQPECHSLSNQPTKTTKRPIKADTIHCKDSTCDEECVALANNEEEEDFIFVPGETGLELPVRGQAYSGHINIVHDKKAEDRG